MEQDVESDSQRNVCSCAALSSPMIRAIAAYFHAMAHPVRMRIVLALANRELAVRDLVNEMALPQPVVSRHLAILRQAGIAERRPQLLNALADDAAVRVYQLAHRAKCVVEPEWHL